MRVFTKEEVSLHDSLHEGLWIIYRDHVYDVSEFALDHPGGVDIVIHYGGKDITQLMSDPSIHDHSPMAFQLLEKYKIGRLEQANESGKISLNAQDSGKKTLRQAKVVPDDNFVDLHEPLVHQIFFPPNNKKMTKKYYLEQVHCPRYLPYPATFFANPMLEVFTRTPWWLIAWLWIPCFLYLVFAGLQYFPPWKILVFVTQGLFLWSIIEYTVHRFVFHLDAFLPDHQFFFGIHFLMHGVHHFLPMDRYRLVLPPSLFCPLAYAFWSLYHGIFPPELASVIFSGSLLGYIVYDLNHYYMHHGKPLTEHLRHMKTYHINHHYLNYELGFGITSKFWDEVFGSLLPDSFTKDQ